MPVATPVPIPPVDPPLDIVDSLLDLFDQLDDARRLYRLQGSGPLARLKVQAWSLRESLSEPWQLELVCLSSDARLDLDAMLHQRVSLFSRLADGSEVERSGIVLEARAEDADGGLARYRLSVAPWLALLAYGTHSRVFQDKSVRDIVDAVFAACPGAEWRWADDADAHLARSARADARGQRSYCVQYRESDLAFVSRLLAEEGIASRFDEADRHGLVLFADSTRIDSCPDDDASASAAGGAGLRFHRDAQVEEQDVILTLGASHVLPVHTITTLGWDYKAKRAVAASAPTLASVGSGHAPQLEAYDPAGAYPYAGSAGAARAAELMQQAHEARHETWIGTGTVRSFGAGRSFALRQSPLDVLDAVRHGRAWDARRFVLTSVTHAGINNLPQRASDTLARLGMGVDPADDDPWSEPVFPSWVDADLRAQAARGGYANRFEAIAQQVPWRPATHDGHGLRLRPKPTAQPQIATVVGPDGQTSATGADEIHTDRLGRVRIQFTFQRQQAGTATGSTNTSTSTNSTWVRVLQRWAGAGMGMQWIPRIGQEVLVDFFDGDIDRPYVMGALYNGRGEGGTPATPGGRDGKTDTTVFGRSHDHQPGAQGNLTGGSSPAWHGASPHALDAQGQANAAALSGFKTKEFGGEGFNQLVFDDTDAQSRVQLMTTQHATQLNLGHLIHQADNHRGGLRGQGFELRTDAYGAIRATQGVLLSTYGQQPHEPAGDNAPALALQCQLEQLAKATSDAARTHQAVALAASQGTTKANGGVVIDTMPPLAAVTRILKGMVDNRSHDHARHDVERHATTTGPDKLPHTTEPMVVFAAKAGLHQVAGQHIEAAAGETLTLAAGQDIDQAAGGAVRIHTGQAIGVLAGAVKPGDQAAGKGLTMIAGTGMVDIQAQSDTLTIAAQQDVSIQSQNSHVDWAAAKKITLATEGGASIVIEGGNISVQCPGTITVRASRKSFVGPRVTQRPMPELPAQPLPSREWKIDLHLADLPGTVGHALAHTPWKLVRGPLTDDLALGTVSPEAVVAEGVTDDQGRMTMSAQMQEKLIQRCTSGGGNLVLLFPGQAMPMATDLEGNDWSDDRKALTALRAWGFSEHTYAHAAGPAAHALLRDGAEDVEGQARLDLYHHLDR